MLVTRKILIFKQLCHFVRKNKTKKTKEKKKFIWGDVMLCITYL